MKAVRIAMAVSVAAMTLLIPSATASADDGDTGASGALCPKNTVCFWQESDPSGPPDYKYYNPQNHTCDNVPGGYARVVQNNTPKSWTFYNEPNCNGNGQVLDPGHKENLGTVNSWK
ncbi:peptidase inhibitor family I36 protein [Streptomyces sp. NPDC003077]|uniref:peptidase inhibitor family I36 protein n=1 Tax=Streptomyces sp. NPDC003077 TaxID=3154443 RepID=UPI0033B6D7B0